MSIIHKDPTGTFIQSVPETGYSDMAIQKSTHGGYGGGSFRLPPELADVANQMFVGSIIEWWHHG